MTVYVDDPVHPFGRMLMCHCIADTREELLAMMTLIGVQHKWIQHKDHWHEHFDISKGKRDQAIRNGAVPLSSKDLVRKLMSRRTAGNSIQEAGDEQGSLL